MKIDKRHARRASAWCRCQQCMQIETHYWANYHGKSGDWHRRAFTRRDQWVPYRVNGFTRTHAEELIRKWNSGKGRDKYKLDDELLIAESQFGKKIIMNNTKTKIEELNKAIDAIPGICSDGRKGIRDLVSKITGVDLTPKLERTFKKGQRIFLKTREAIICRGGDWRRNRMQIVYLDTGGRSSSPVAVKNTLRITESELTQMLADSYSLADVK